MAASVLPAVCYLIIFVFYPIRVHCRSSLIHLDESTWSQMVEGEWMVEFFAPWCPACKGLQSVWEDFSTWSNDLGIHVAQVDVTTNPGLSGRFLVTALPTIYHVKDGQFRQYRGPRDKESFITFIEEKKWKQLEEVSKWKTPSSLQMYAVSYFFKLSMTLRSIHNHLVEGYGLPYWASFVLFGVVTVVIGSILGLLLVCIVDLVFPPKSYGLPLPPTPPPAPPQQPAEASESKDDDDDPTETLDSEKKNDDDKEQTSVDQSPSRVLRKRKPPNVDQ